MTEQAKSNFIGFRADDAMLSALASRAGDRGEAITARRDLERYYHALAAELRAVDLSQAEAMLILDALNGVMHELHAVRLLWASIADAISLDELDRKWEVDGAALVAKLRGLTYTQALAVVDAVERWWNTQPFDDREQSLKGVGMIR